MLVEQCLTWRKYICDHRISVSPKVTLLVSPIGPFYGSFFFLHSFAVRDMGLPSDQICFA